MAKSTTLMPCLALALLLIPAAPSLATPTIRAAPHGERVAVFATPQESCSPNDIPDAMARAFRDAAGTIHFTTASSDLYESLGPTLDRLKHSCKPAFLSANDADPAKYNDQVWIDSYYTLDGTTVVGLSHTEYHGWAHPNECHESQNLGACEYDSDTFHLSTDGGYHFKSFQAPHNYVAGFPYRYQIDDGPMGYSVDSNIIPCDNWYYAIVTDYQWPPNCSGLTGPQRCLVPLGGAPMRTRNLFDPASWRTWSGRDFSIGFADPYAAPVGHPGQHIFTPVPYMEYVNGLNVLEPSHLVVATLWDYYDEALGPPGLYFTTSTDLVTWTTPRLVVTLAEIAPRIRGAAGFMPISP